MKKIISLLIAIGVIGCEKVKLVTPEEAEKREMLEAVRTHTQVMEAVISNIEEIGSILEDKEEITIVDVLNAVEEIDGVERDVKTKVSAVRRELEEGKIKNNLIFQFTKEKSIDSVMREIIGEIEDNEVKKFVGMVYDGLRECEDIEEMIQCLEILTPNNSSEEKALEFGKKLLEDGKNTIYNEKWWEKQGIIKNENKGIPLWVIGIGACDVFGGILSGLQKEKEIVVREKVNERGEVVERKVEIKERWRWNWWEAGRGAIGASGSAAMGKFLL
jgi:hypothetical protein